MASVRPSASHLPAGLPAEERPKLVPHPNDADLFAPDPELDKPLSAEATAWHLRWLETGEGEPWPPASSS